MLHAPHPAALLHKQLLGMMDYRMGRRRCGVSIPGGSPLAPKMLTSAEASLKVKGLIAWCCSPQIHVSGHLVQVNWPAMAINKEACAECAPPPLALVAASELLKVPARPRKAKRAVHIGERGRCLRLPQHHPQQQRAPC